jgi:hypothetical protein
MNRQTKRLTTCITKYEYKKKTFQVILFQDVLTSTLFVPILQYFQLMLATMNSLL